MDPVIDLSFELLLQLLAAVRISMNIFSGNPVWQNQSQKRVSATTAI